MDGDWLKLHRCILDSAIFTDDWLTRLWIWCLCKANFRDNIFRGQAVKRGQFITGRVSGAGELHVSPSKWYRGLEKLAELGNITIDTNSNWTTVTICRFTDYQRDSADREQQMNSERTGSEQDLNNERTASDTTNGQPADTTKECKKERKKEENKEPPNPQGGKSSDVTADSLTYPEGFDTPEVRQAVEQWLSYKRSRRQAYKTAATAQQIWKTADWKSIGPDGFIAAVGRSIGNNYQGIFPDKSFQPKQKVPLKTDNGESLDAYFDKLAAE